MRVIVWQNADGTISLTYPNERPMAGENEGMFMDRIAMEYITHCQNAGWAVPRRMPDVDSSHVPKSRRFRPAWRCIDPPSNGQRQFSIGASPIYVNADEARQIRLAELREQKIFSFMMSLGAPTDEEIQMLNAEEV